MTDLAAALVELWAGYLAQRDPRFPPSLTDFMLWLREYETSSFPPAVKTTRTSPQIPLTPREPVHSVPQPAAATVKSVEADVAQPTGGAAIGTIEKVRILELWKEGYSAPRIRQMIGLDVPIGRIYGIVGKRK